jgi:transforming growth factor-beta-induced protein
MLVRRLPFRLMALPALLLALTACKDDTTRPPPPPSVAGTVTADPNLSTLNDLLGQSGLRAELEKRGPFTLFAPVNAAFGALPSDVLAAVLADEDLLKEVLLNHVVSGDIRARRLSDGEVLTTLGGGKLNVSVQGGVVRIAGATVTEADRVASNGVVHIIDAVLVPEPAPDIVDTAIAAGFSTLVTAVQAAGLEETLRSAGPFTVFAPTNGAFDHLPAGALEALLNDIPALTEVLLYHVVPGRISARDLRDGQELTTVQGKTIKITLKGQRKANDARIRQTDVEASNGIIHVIDAVLMPPMDIVDQAIAAGFSTLVTAVQAAGLESALRGDGPFTVFAPTNAAFDALPAGTLEALLADIPALTEILTFHVVPGRITAADLAEGKEVVTLEGRKLRFSLEGGAKVNGVNITATDIETSNGIIHVIDAVLIPVPDLVDTAIGAGFSTLVTAVQAAGLEDALRGDGPFTVFAPTNAAFDALPAGTLEALLADIPALAEILTFHVVPGRITAADLAEGKEVVTLEGRKLRFTLGGGARVNGVNITATDIETSNGIIHVIDAVLIPPVDIVETAVAAGFGTLVAAVQAAGLEDALRGDGPFTVFAPTDAAFGALPDGTVEALLADPPALAEILTYHVVPGRIFAADLSEGKELTTLQGETIRITLAGGPQVNGADIVGTDVLATNGVIHIINAVLIP